MRVSPLCSEFLVTEDGRVFRPDGSPANITSNGLGYTRAIFSKDGKRIAQYVHRLVASAYCAGYAPGLVVNHIDHNPGNNHYTNLEWVTQKQNLRHAAKAGRMHGIEKVAQRGEAHGMCKLSADRVLEIRRQLAIGVSGASLAATYGVSSSLINTIKHRRLWRDLQPEEGTVIPKPRARLTREQRQEILVLVSEGVKQREIADKFGVDQSTISSIKIGRR